VDYSSPALCTPVTPFLADPIFSECGSDGMIPCAAWHYWRLNDPLCSERVIVHCQWGRKPLPSNRQRGLSSICRRRTEKRTWATCTKNLVKIVGVVPEISCRTDRQAGRQAGRRAHHNTLQPLSQAK